MGQRRPLCGMGSGGVPCGRPAVGVVGIMVAEPYPADPAATRPARLFLCEVDYDRFEGVTPFQIG